MQWLNDALGGVVEWVRTQPGLALTVLLTLQSASLALALGGWMRTGRIQSRQDRMLRGATGESLERMLLDYADTTSDVQGRLDAARDVGGRNTESIRQSFRRVGLVRYDAFPNIGGRQSFSLALLDDANCGILLTSLVSRQDSRVYAKPVAAGVSPTPLTGEEREALRRARIPSELSVED